MPSLDVLVIGGGQAGLAVGYYLQRAGCDFAILDSGSEIGAAWRSRWDSLVLFTPTQFDNLPGLPIPGEVGSSGTDLTARCPDGPLPGLLSQSSIASKNRHRTGDDQAGGPGVPFELHPPLKPRTRADPPRHLNEPSAAPRTLRYAKNPGRSSAPGSRIEEAKRKQKTWRGLEGEAIRRRSWARDQAHCATDTQVSDAARPAF
jgi:hypothetical protein